MTQMTRIKRSFPRSGNLHKTEVLAILAATRSDKQTEKAWSKADVLTILQWALPQYVRDFVDQGSNFTEATDSTGRKV